MMGKFTAAGAILITVVSCAGVYGGLDGPAVISRRDALRKIVDARMVRLAVCPYNETEVLRLYSILTQSDRKTLDGSYYETNDVDECVKGILLTACSSALRECGMTPKSFLSGKLFQGGF